MFDKKDFITNQLPAIKNGELYQKAKKSKVLKLWQENGERTDITALWTVYKKNELAPGHEGVQFGIYFKKVGCKYKFAGMETIP